MRKRSTFGLSVYSDLLWQILLSDTCSGSYFMNTTVMISTHCFDEGETEPLVDSYLCIIYASIGVRDWRMPKWHPLLPGSMCWPDLWIRSDMSLTVSNFGLINQPIKKEILKLPLVLNCLFLHAGLDALLISTILASISLAFINCTLPIVPARIIQVFTNCSLEKSLAAWKIEISIFYRWWIYVLNPFLTGILLTHIVDG